MLATFRTSLALRTSTTAAIASLKKTGYRNDQYNRYLGRRCCTMSSIATSGLSQIPKKPLIVIIGSTGTGKSNLAISIAKYLSRSPVQSEISSELPIDRNYLQSHGFQGAEIINADAMQLYAGLPIITNKLSLAEQEGIPHHLLGSIQLSEDTWTVTRFVKEAGQCIQDIYARGNLPVVVGGTGYYVHGLLMAGSTLDPRDVATSVTDGVGENGAQLGDELADGARHGQNGDTEERLAQIDAILNSPNEEIYAKLQEVDPVMASQWHPNDRRKIQRSLEIWLRTGKKASDVYAAQKLRQIPENQSSDNPSQIPGSQQLRYDPLIFWLDAEDTVLKDRLNKRVDLMLERGLISEAETMADYADGLAEKGVLIDSSKGIWASIGFKELEPWIRREEDHDSPQAEKKSIELRNSCVEAVKAGTRRYAKRQNRYIRIRFANALAKQGASDKLFLLDCSNLEKWQDLVEQVATTLTDDFLTGRPLPSPESLSDLACQTFARMASEDSSHAQRLARRCETCNKVLVTQKEWDNHVNSRSHKKNLEGVKRRFERQSQVQHNAELVT